MPKVARLIIERSAGHQSRSGKRAQTHTGATPLPSFGGCWRKGGGYCQPTAQHWVPQLHLLLSSGPREASPESATGQTEGAGLQDPSEDSQPWLLGRRRALCGI